METAIVAAAAIVARAISSGLMCCKKAVYSYSARAQASISV